MRPWFTTILAFLFFGLSGHSNLQAQSPDDSSLIDRPSAEVEDPSTLVKLELLEEVKLLDDSVRELRSEIDKLARAMELSEREQGKKIADLESRVSKIESSGRALRDEKISFEAEYKTLSKKVEVLEQFLKRNLGELVSASGLEANAARASESIEKEAIDPKVKLPPRLENFGDVERYYSYALKDVVEKQENFSYAIRLFSDISTAFPDHPKAMLALYWRALCAYNLGPPEKALELTMAALEDISRDHAKYPHTLLLLGKVYVKLQNYSQANYAWQRVIEEYPEDKNSVELAKERIKQFKIFE